MSVGELAPSLTGSSTQKSGPLPHLGSRVELALLEGVWLSQNQGHEHKSSGPTPHLEKAGELAGLGDMGTGEVVS